MNKKQIIAGVVTPLIELLVIILLIQLNPWWVITKNAISDLGNISNPKVKYPFLLDISIIVTGIAMLYFSVGLIRVEKSVGEIIFTIGIVFLILIGLFPEGTRIHWPVSLLFFVLTSMGIFVFGIEKILNKNLRMGITSISLFVLGWLLALISMNMFSGVAIAELIGIILLISWILIRVKEIGLLKITKKDTSG